MPKTKKKNQIVKVNVTRLKQVLKDKLDNIDENVEKKVYNNFYESRLRIEMSMWKKGKAIASYFRGVNYEVISFAELSRQTGRSDMSLKKWYKLYKEYPDKKNYQQIAEEKAQSWTAKVFYKNNALADGESEKNNSDEEDWSWLEPKEREQRLQEIEFKDTLYKEIYRMFVKRIRQEDLSFEELWILHSDVRGIISYSIYDTFVDKLKEVVSEITVDKNKKKELHKNLKEEFKIWKKFGGL